MNYAKIMNITWKLWEEFQLAVHVQQWNFDLAFLEKYLWILQFM